MAPAVNMFITYLVYLLISRIHAAINMTYDPTIEPTLEPTKEPTIEPTLEPTEFPFDLSSSLPPSQSPLSVAESTLSTLSFARSTIEPFVSIDVNHWIDYVPWIYASIQAIITLTVSIMGVKYVRNEFLLQKNRVLQQTQAEIQMNVLKSSDNLQREHIEDQTVILNQDEENQKSTNHSQDSNIQLEDIEVSLG